jgi:hypothetical protein
MSDFDTKLAFLKALAHDKRLRMVGLLATQPRSVQELAAMLDLKEPTVSHHLAMLAKIDLVDMQAEGNTHWYRIRESELQRLGRSVFAKDAATEDEAESEKAWETRVLENFLDGEKLKQIPASRKKRWFVLRWLAEKFKPGKKYPEASVNEIIQRHHWDSATLRRELIGHRMLSRDKGIYWREPETQWRQVES